MTNDSMQQIIQRVLVDQVGETIKGFYAPPYGSSRTAGKIAQALRKAGYTTKIVCVVCGGPAKYSESEQLWRHAAPDIEVICDRYGYPIPVRIAPTA